MFPTSKCVIFGGGGVEYIQLEMLNHEEVMNLLGWKEEIDVGGEEWMCKNPSVESMSFVMYKFYFFIRFVPIQSI